MNTSFNRHLFFFAIGIILGLFVTGIFVFRNWVLLFPGFWLSVVVVATSFVLCFQGIITILSMLYTWENPNSQEKNKSPDVFSLPDFTFSALIPARHEKKVIAETIRAVSDIEYPEHLKEIIVLCHYDDEETICEVNKTIGELGKSNIRLIISHTTPINKPHSLNIGLRNAKNQIVTVFDAEDQPHRDIYNIVNTLMITEQADVVQSGVQLMNYRTHWFSSINVLEYFFWFKSGLHFLLKIGNVIPLGGNTVFFKKYYLEQIGGWDESCLTEDADVGIRLAQLRARVRIVYDHQHVTREETPDSIGSFIKQRTRWNHGFMQIMLKGDWTRLPQTRQKIIALYTLFTPILQTAFLLYLPIEVWIAIHYKLPIVVSIISFFPAYILFFQIAVYVVGIREFTKTYKLAYSLWDSLQIVLVFLPYQIMLTIASLRAVTRLAYKQNGWEKTMHHNIHRAPTSAPALTPAYVYVKEYV